MVAPTAPKARHGCDEDTGTVAPASPPAPSNSPAAPRTAIPDAIPGIPGDDRPAGHLGGQEHPAAKAGRRGGPASRRPDHQPREGAGAGLRIAGTGRGPGHDQAHIRVSAAPAWCRYGPGRADRRPGRPVPFRRWHRIRAGMSIAEPRPPAGSGRADHPGWSCPGRQRAVPGTGLRPGLPGCRAGEGGACRAVNRAHTTFPASLGVV
jgi:hypothetical protein